MLAPTPRVDAWLLVRDNHGMTVDGTATNRHSGFAIASFVVGIIVMLGTFSFIFTRMSVFPAVVGVALSFIGIAFTSRLLGRWMAITGFVLNVIPIVLAIIRAIGSAS